MASGAALWGLFWIPLRYLDNAGIHGLWAVAMVCAAAFIPALAILLLKREFQAVYKTNCWLVGFALGLATILYFTGILYSDVIRVIFLFYLLPVWTTLSARILYAEPIRRAQIPVLGAAVVGVWLLLGGGRALPVPQNVGDWCGILAGLCWGVSLSLLRGRAHSPALATTAAAMAAGTVLAIGLACLVHRLQWGAQSGASLPELNTWLSMTPLALLFGMLAMFPAMIGQIWGAHRIPAPTAALLTMSEIVVATLSAAWLVGTDLKPISLLGGLIIVAAVIVDLRDQYRRAA